ncbi:hypothetical protein B0H19DRAFT_1384653, partial [Mycena capillaripes]
MGDAPQVDQEYTSSTSINDAGSVLYAGAFFPKSRDFVIEGGIFTSNTTHVSQAPSLSSDFRMIPLGDIDLQREICLNGDSAIIDCRDGRRYIRKMYTAKINREQADMTVAIWEGENAEDNWKHHIYMLSRIRHPNIVQLYGVAKSSSIYAAVFHDDLIPFGHFLNIYGDCHFSIVYFWAFVYAEHRSARHYINSVSQTSIQTMVSLWIRRSSGRLCIEPAADHISDS